MKVINEGRQEGERTPVEVQERADQKAATVREYRELVKARAQYQVDNPDAKNKWLRKAFRGYLDRHDEYSVAMGTAIANIANAEYKYALLLAYPQVRKGRARLSKNTRKKIQEIKSRHYQVFVVEPFNEESLKDAIREIDGLRLCA